jgi:hypothetical protein
MFSADHIYGGVSRPCLFLAGTADAAESGMVCTRDFVVIPDPSQDGPELYVDRFCGNALLPTTSKFPVIFTVCSENV